MSIGEILILGLRTTAIGMGIVFATLIFLSGVIVLQAKLLYRKEKDPG